MFVTPQSQRLFLIDAQTLGIDHHPVHLAGSLDRDLALKHVKPDRFHVALKGITIATRAVNLMVDAVTRLDLKMDVRLGSQHGLLLAGGVDIDRIAALSAAVEAL